MNRTEETDTTKETEWSDSTKKKNQELRQDKENLEMNQIILQQKKEMPSSKWGTVQKQEKKGGKLDPVGSTVRYEVMKLFTRSVQETNGSYLMELSHYKAVAVGNN